MAGRTRLSLAAQVLELILQRGPLSRANLRRSIGTSFSMVTIAVQDLFEAGLLVESDEPCPPAAARRRSSMWRRTSVA